MEPNDPRVGLMPSMLDRLIDEKSGGTEFRRGYAMEQVVIAVRRDLEDLLNTRESHPNLPRDYPELLTSVYAYGLPDFTAKNAQTSEDRHTIGQMVEGVVEQFEPRLRDVRAIQVEEDEGEARTLRFQIDARLRVEPCPEVAFETTLELTTGHASVKQST